MSHTVHPSDSPNLPARVSNQLRSGRHVTHRQMIAARTIQEEYEFRREVSGIDRARAYCLFRTAKPVSHDTLMD